MSDILELSSDSSDTIICPFDDVLNQDNVVGDVNIQEVVNKYISLNHAELSVEYSAERTHAEHNSTTTKAKLSHFSERSLSNSSSSQDDINAINVCNIENDPVLKLLSKKYRQSNTSDSNENVTTKGKGTSSDSNETGTKKEKAVAEREIRKREKEIQKRLKIEERLKKKKQTEQDKMLKKALAEANKNMKPMECLRFITVNIDREIISKEIGNEIITALQATDINYNVQDQVFPSTISWTRKAQSHVNEEGNLMLLSQDSEADQILLIMHCKELLEHISGNTLSGLIESLKLILVDKKLTLAINGLQTYFRYQKNKRNSDFKDQIANTNAKQNKNHQIFKDLPIVTRRSIEYALTEIQMNGCSHRLLETASDIALMVAQFTKSIAEIPFKSQRKEKYQQTDWFAAGDNRDCVKVDKDGNGLKRLWSQMLTTFPLARLETAEAISLEYPTIPTLLKAYDNCSSSKEGELLLQNIPIRRAAGPLSSARKIGPEMSKKIYNFFTSMDGEALI